MRFKNRFSLFYGNYMAIPQRERGQSVVFARETDVDSIWLISNFLLEHGLPRPTRLLDIVAQHRLAEPLNTAMLKLCRQLTAYGDCLRYTCRYRHLLWRPEVLPPDHYPTEGEIRFTVLGVSILCMILTKKACVKQIFLLTFNVFSSATAQPIYRCV